LGFLFIKNYKNFRPLADVHLHCTALTQRAGARLVVSASGNRGCVLCPGNPVKEAERLNSFSMSVFLLYYFVAVLRQMILQLRF